MEENLLHNVNNYNELYIYLDKMIELRKNHKLEDKFLWYLRH